MCLYKLHVGKIIFLVLHFFKSTSFKIATFEFKACCQLTEVVADVPFHVMPQPIAVQRNKVDCDVALMRRYTRWEVARQSFGTPKL